MLEGPTLVDEALTHGGRLVRVFALASDPLAARARQAGIEVLEVTPEVLAKVATTRHPQSPVAIAQVADPGPVAAGDLICPWGLGDPGNLGTLIRTAAGFGMGVATGPGTTEVWAPKTLRSGAGSHFRTPITPVDDLDELRVGGRQVVATVVSGGLDLAAAPFDTPVAILVGDEAHGLESSVVERCDLLVTIAMPGGTESLNASVAGAIIAYEVNRRRRAPGH